MQTSLAEILKLSVIQIVNIVMKGGRNQMLSLTSIMSELIIMMVIKVSLSSQMRIFLLVQNM